jgi:hypothetical protein
MARIRSVKPEFFTSLAIGDLSERARLAFIGIWTYVDDYGRGTDDPRLVKAAVFPLDDRISVRDVAKIIDELAAACRLQRYEVDGRRYFVVVNWNEHQKIDRRSASKLPPPPGETVPTGHRTCSEGSTRMQRGLDEGSLPDQGAGSRERIREQGAGSNGSGNRAESFAAAAALKAPDVPPAAAAAVETILTIRRNEDGGQIHNERRWLAQTRPKILDEHLPAMLAHLATTPDADPRALVLACGFREDQLRWAGVA